MSNENCKGCRVYDGDCWFHNNTNRCPCGTCLIKAMCDNTCEAYEKYERIEYEYRNILRGNKP